MSMRWVMVAGALLLCATPPVAMAATESTMTLTLGHQMPLFDFESVARDGVVAALSGGYRATSWLETGVAFAYYRDFGKRDGQWMEIYDELNDAIVDITLTENWTITQLGLYAKGYFLRRGRLSTYLVGGTGSYTVRYSQDVSAASAATTVGGHEQSNKFGLNAGLGFAVRILGGTTVGIDARYHHLFARNSRLDFYTTGLTCGFGPGGK